MKLNDQFNYKLTHVGTKLRLVIHWAKRETNYIYEIRESEDHEYIINELNEFLKREMIP